MLKYISAILIIGSLNGCYYNNEEDLVGNIICDTTAVTYSGHVSQIISTNCLVCHSAGSSLGGGIVLEGYAVSSARSRSSHPKLLHPAAQGAGI